MRPYRAPSPLLVVACQFSLVAVVVTALLWICYNRYLPAVFFVAATISLVVTRARLDRHQKALEEALRERTTAPSTPRRHLVTFKLPVTPNELDALYPVFREVFGDDILPLPELQKILAINPNTIWRVGVEREGTTDGSRKPPPEYIGFFEVFPLKPTGLRALRDYKRDGRSFRASDVYARSASATDFYIASVGALPGSAHPVQNRAAVVRELWSYLTTLNENRTITLYTRPVTEDGVRLAEKYGFSQLDKEPSLPAAEAIWVRRLPAGTLIRRLP